MGIVQAVVRWAGHLMSLAAVVMFLALGLGPHTGAYRTLTVLSGSMAPAIPAGAVVLVRPVDPADVAVGDVVTYNIPVEDRRVVTHRVVDIIDPGPTPTLVTKGDAVDDPDPWAALFSSGPAWKTVAVVPKLGYVLQVLQSPLVRRTSVTVLPALFALVWLWDIWRPRRREDERVRSWSMPLMMAPPGEPVALPSEPAREPARALSRHAV